MEEHVVKIRRCAAVVKGGRRFSFNALVVVGDKRGRVAYGYGKANEVPPAVEKATKDAEDADEAPEAHLAPRRHHPAPRHRPLRQQPGHPGSGRSGHGRQGRPRRARRADGVRHPQHPDQGHGSTNPINLVKATIQGLLQLRTREDVARLRGVTL